MLLCLSKMSIVPQATGPWEGALLQKLHSGWRRGASPQAVQLETESTVKRIIICNEVKAKGKEGRN